MDAQNYTCNERKVSYLICSSVALEVAFEIANATSLFKSNSAFFRRDKSGGNISAFITACNENKVSNVSQNVTFLAVTT